MSGVGAGISVGKEWWVGTDWGLGLAGFFSFSNPADKDPVSDQEYPITNTVVGLVFSATYN